MHPKSEAFLHSLMMLATKEIKDSTDHALSGRQETEPRDSLDFLHEQCLKSAGSMQIVVDKEHYNRVVTGVDDAKTYCRS